MLIDIYFQKSWNKRTPCRKKDITLQQQQWRIGHSPPYLVVCYMRFLRCLKVRNRQNFKHHKDSKHGVPLLSMTNAVDTLCTHKECTMLIDFFFHWNEQFCLSDCTFIEFVVCFLQTRKRNLFFRIIVILRREQFVSSVMRCLPIPVPRSKDWLAPFLCSSLSFLLQAKTL